jgi:cytochrome b561
MPLRNTTARWGAIAQLLHWGVVALVITQFVLANVAEDLPLGPDKVGVLARHKSVGITILMLALLRLAWRTANPVPVLPAGLKTWERRLARGTHAALYVLLFAIPLSGWAMSSARNFPVSWFGLVQLPDFVQPSRAAYDLFHEVHEVLGRLLIAVTVLHVLAALKHHFVLKDDVLRRMLPALLLGCLTLGAAEVARAAEYSGGGATGKLAFHFMQAGAESPGRFGRFDVMLEIEGATPRELEVNVDVASLDTQDGERDALLRGADLFDTATHPTARFVASSFVPLGANRYEARGSLTLRGVSRATVVPFTLQAPVARKATANPATTSPASTKGRMSGAVTIRRLDFGVGQGDWKSTEWVADEVRVDFDVPLAPRAAPPAGAGGG